MVEELLGQRGDVREDVLLRFAVPGAEQVVGELRLVGAAAEDHAGADADGFRVGFLEVGDLGLLQQRVELGAAGGEGVVVLAGHLVFGIFLQVAEFLGELDGLLDRGEAHLDDIFELTLLLFLRVLGDEEFLLFGFGAGVLGLGEALDVRLDLGETGEEGLLGHLVEALAAHHRAGEVEDGLAVGLLAVGGDEDVRDELLVLDQFVGERDAGRGIGLEGLRVDRRQDGAEERGVDQATDDVGILLGIAVLDDPDDDRGAQFAGLKPLGETTGDGGGEFLVAEVRDGFGDELGGAALGAADVAVTEQVEGALGPVVAMVGAHEVEEAADLLGGVRDVQRDEGEVAFGAEGDDLGGRRADGLDVLDGGAEELVAVPDAAEDGGQVVALTGGLELLDLLGEIGGDLVEVGGGGGGAGLGSGAGGEFFEEDELTFEIRGAFVLGEEVFAEVLRGLEEGVEAALAFRDEDGAVLAEGGAALGPPGLEGGGAVLAGGQGGEKDTVEVGFEGVGGAFAGRVFGEEGLHDAGRVVGDQVGDLGLGGVGIGLGHDAVGIDDLDLAKEEGGVHGMGLLVLLGEVDGQALGGLVVGADDSDTPGLVEAEGRLTRGDQVDGGLQGVDFTTLWVGGLVAHCKSGFWA